MRAKVLIVGGGVVGTAVALHASRGRDPIAEPVVLLEKAGLAAGASGCSAGVVHQQDERRTVAGMARDAVRFYETFRARTGRSAGFRRSGVLTLAGAEGAARLERNARMLASIGIDAQLVRGPEIRGLVEGIQVPDDAIGIYEPSGGFLDPALTVESFASLARFYGAATRLGVEVHELHVHGGRVRGALTSEGDYEADQVVLTAGPWLHRLANDIGVDLPLRIVRTEHVYLKLPSVIEPQEPPLGEGLSEDDPWTLEDSGMHAIPVGARKEGDERHIPGLKPVVFDLDRRVCIRWDPERGRVRIGRLGVAEVEDSGSMQDEVPESAAQSLVARAVELLPELGPLPRLSARAAWSTLTHDGRGLAGAIPGVDGLFVATAFTNHEFHLAPCIGEGLAQHLRGVPVAAFDPEYFSPERFAAAT